MSDLAPAFEAETATSTPGLRDFHNRLRILLNVGMYDLEDAGIIEQGDVAAWERFQASPWRWFIGCGDEQAAKLWALMNSRSSRHITHDDLMEVVPELLRHSEAHYGAVKDQGTRIGLAQAKARAAIARAEA